jgi:ELWxxDGT repeat protein
MVRQITPGPWAGSSNGVIDFNGALIFNARETSTGYELWRSDGTQDGTTLLFSASDGVNGEELWSTEGTVAGTVPVKDNWPVSSSSLPIP